MSSAHSKVMVVSESGETFDMFEVLALQERRATVRCHGVFEVGETISLAIESDGTRSTARARVERSKRRTDADGGVEIELLLLEVTPVRRMVSG